MNLKDTDIYRWVNRQDRRWRHYRKKGSFLGCIFMLHRVDYRDKNRLLPNENMKVSPKFLADFFDRYKHEYDFLALPDVPNRLYEKGKRPFMAFSLDDGYKDNFTQALPIFEQHNVPFTVFVATDFPDRKAVLWWYVLEEYLLSRSSVTLADGRKYSLNTLADKEAAFMDIRSSILELDQTNLLQELPRLFVENISWGDVKNDVFMSWDDVRSLSAHPLATIGCHTQHHYNLRQLSTSKDVIAEVMTGRQILQEKAQVETTVFAYPYGSSNEVGNREIEVLSKLPFSVACVAYGDWLGSREPVNPYALPRLMLTEDFSEDQLS